MILDIAIMAVVGGLIGWFTNYLAIKMIFRPYNPVRIPLLGLEIQGLIPKRRAEIAESIGKTVETELISIDDLIDSLMTDDNKKDIIINIKSKILMVIDDKIPSIIPGAIRRAIMGKVADIVDNETDSFVNNMMSSTIKKAAGSINVSKIVENKINGFELDKIEALIIEIANRELKAIEVLGGVLGFLIGVVQGIIVQFI